MRFIATRPMLSPQTRRLRENNETKRRRRTRASAQEPRSSYDPLQRLDKRELVRRIRTLERELDAERRQRGARVRPAGLKRKAAAIRDRNHSTQGREVTTRLKR